MNKYMRVLICGGFLLLNYGFCLATVIDVPHTGGSFQVFGEYLDPPPDNSPGEIHSSAWGQTFRLHAGDGQYLKSISFGLVDYTYDEDNIDFTLHIYEWDGSKIVGDEIFSSRVLSTNNTAEATKFNISLNYVRVEVETDYMWILNVVHDGVEGAGGVEHSYGGTYADGSFYIFQNYNDGDLSMLFTNGWQEICPSGCRDLAFSLETLSSMVDSENDKMLDEWEEQHGLNSSINDASEDKDGDGYTNLQEYYSGTNPEDESSKPQHPIANAGDNQTLYEGDTVILDGSNSTDHDDGIASYLWTQTSGASVTLYDATAVKTNFLTCPVDTNGATLAFKLTVTDSVGLQASNEVTITINDNGISGFPDDVLTFATSTGENIGGKIVSGGEWISLDFIDPYSIADTANRPDDLIYGLIETELKTNTLGGIVNVTFYLPVPASEDYMWYKYNETDGWLDFSANAVFNEDRDQITLTLIDGGAGDDDGIENGIIIDPSGLGIIVEGNGGDINDGGSADGGGGGGGGCFIATAAYGSSIEPHVKILRDFCDNVLSNCSIGRAFVQVYYICSPPVAGFITKHPNLRAITRVILLPIVGVSWVALTIGPACILVLMLFSVICLIGFGKFRRSCNKS